MAIIDFLKEQKDLSGWVGITATFLSLLWAIYLAYTASRQRREVKSMNALASYKKAELLLEEIHGIQTGLIDAFNSQQVSKYFRWQPIASFDRYLDALVPLVTLDMPSIYASGHMVQVLRVALQTRAIMLAAQSDHTDPNSRKDLEDAIKHTEITIRRFKNNSQTSSIWRRQIESL